jgi:hypothetical protein
MGKVRNIHKKIERAECGCGSIQFEILVDPNNTNDLGQNIAFGLQCRRCKEVLILDCDYANRFGFLDPT